MKECKHKFRPRYDRVWTTVVGEIIARGGKVTKAYDGLEPYVKSETYVHDICVKCGLVKGKEK